jgi:3-oxoacyl-[acyl-carrier protein] reductase
VLVPNAGVGRIRAAIEDVSDEDWDTHVAVNLTAPFVLARCVAPGMASRGYGRILFVSSVAAFTGGVVGPHYAASKAGLHGLTHWLASRLAGNGVTVNALAPALIERTGMLPGSSDELSARIPVGRLGTPEEVADLALAVMRNGYLTNQVFTLDGGIYSR